MGIIILTPRLGVILRACLPAIRDSGRIAGLGSRCRAASLAWPPTLCHGDDEIRHSGSAKTLLCRARLSWTAVARVIEPVFDFWRDAGAIEILFGMWRC